MLVEDYLKVISRFYYSDTTVIAISMNICRCVCVEVDTVRYFSCRKIRFIWDPDLSQFYRLNGLDNEVPTSYFHQEKGLSSLEQYLRYDSLSTTSSCL